MTASTRPGMGAIAFDGGVTFRVWAPNATAVAVAGSFNAWSATATPLSADGGGTFSADVPAAKTGDEYKFVVTTPLAAAPIWRNDPWARSLTNSVGNSIIAEHDFPWSAAGYRTPSWDELVIYQLHVGSFLFDPATPNGRGNFDTVITKLDYLSDLGISAIQLLPTDEFPGDVSWGYNPSYIFAIESSYGGPNGLRRLVDAAHARGLGVIYDVVYNHLGPSDLDLWRFDGWGQDGGGGVYFYNDDRRHTPWGDTRPDYGRGEVRSYIRDNALRWLEDRQCDGLRWDATGYIRNRDGGWGEDIPEGWSLMQWIHREIRASQPWKISIAEDMQENEWLTKSPEEGGAGFTAQWGAGFLHGVRAMLTAPDDAGRDMPALAARIAQRFNGEAFQRVIYTESHDEVAAGNGEARVPELIWPGNGESWAAQKRSTLGAALVLTAPGIPMIFMGQEFLQTGAWSDATQLEWERADRFAGIRLLYRDLIRLRRDWYATTRGLRGQGVEVHHVNDADKVIGLRRWDQGGPGDDVVVLANCSARGFDAYRIGVPRGGRWRVRFNSDWRGYSDAFGDHPSLDADSDGGAADGCPAAITVGVGPYSCVILSQDG